MLAALAVLGYKWHKARRKAQAEVAFDAALQDSGLGLDDAFEQVRHRQKSVPARVEHRQRASASDACVLDFNTANCTPW